VELCQRLLQMDRHDVAADLFVALDMLREAVEVCVRGKLFDRARELADELEEPELLDDLKAAQVEHLQYSNDADKLANVDVIAALDLYARNGQWDDCMAEAEKHGGQVGLE
jgi:intraflagellar transport protein 172